MQRREQRLHMSIVDLGGVPANPVALDALRLQHDATRRAEIEGARGATIVGSAAGQTDHHRRYGPHLAYRRRGIERCDALLISRSRTDLAATPRNRDLARIIVLPILSCSASYDTSLSAMVFEAIAADETLRHLGNI
jgi:hypothetical protein